MLQAGETHTFEKDASGPHSPGIVTFTHVWSSVLPSPLCSSCTSVRVRRRHCQITRTQYKVTDSQKHYQRLYVQSQGEDHRFKDRPRWEKCSWSKTSQVVASRTIKNLKVKEVDLYSAFIVVPHTQGAQVRITQSDTELQLYLQITPYLPLPRNHSPDGASPDWGCGYLIAVYYSFIYPERMKGWVGLVGWPTADGLPT